LLLVFISTSRSHRKTKGLNQMAWEAWREGGLAARSLRIFCSLFWIALLLLAARSLNFAMPYLPAAIAGGLAFFLRLRTGPYEKTLWVLSSLAFVPVLRFATAHGPIVESFGVLSAFGFGAFVLLGLRWLWSDGAARRTAWALLAPAASMVFFVFSAQHALSLANLLHPKTFDLHLYVFDGSYGFQPSFLLGRAMAHSFLLRNTAVWTYLSLPFVMAVVYALRQPRDAQRPAWDLMTMLMLAGLGGWLLYNVVPATGPAFAFAGDFPWHSLPYRSLHKLFLEQIPVAGDFPRNAIPSLHMAWVLLIYWSVRESSRWWRFFLMGYALLTVVATLGTGEHYFVDLVASLPFALAVYAAVCPDGKPALMSRLSVVASGLGLTLGWLLLVRFGTRWMLLSPFLPWTLSVITPLVVLRMKRSLASPTGSPEEQPTPLAQKAAAASV
jgi:PAP2 superfamily